MDNRFKVTASDNYGNFNVENCQFSGFNFLPLSRLLIGLKGEVKIVVRDLVRNDIVNIYETVSRGI